MRLSESAGIIGGVCNGGDPTFTGCALDSRQVAGGELFVALKGSRVDGHDYIDAARQGGAVAALVERAPGDCAALPWVQVGDTQDAMARLARAWRARFTNVALAVITGSNGKTTVKNMLASILGADALATQGNYNNELGVPLTLFQLGPEHRYAALELGASAPGDIAFLAGLTLPRVAVVTQCAPAHLEGFGSVAAVAQEKAEVYRALPADGIAVINVDDAHAPLWRDAAGHVKKIIGFGLEARVADVSAANVRHDVTAGQVCFTLRLPSGEQELRLPMPGRHQVMNALAAAALAYALGVELAAITRGLQQFTAPPGRLMPRAGLHGCRVLDDTYNANPGSLAAALALLGEYPPPRYLVLGDMGELGQDAAAWHRAALEQAVTVGVERVRTLGPLAAEMARAFTGDGRAYDTHEALSRQLTQELKAGDTVLVKGSRAMAMEKVVAAILASAPMDRGEARVGRDG